VGPVSQIRLPLAALFLAGLARSGPFLWAIMLSADTLQVALRSAFATCSQGEHCDGGFRRVGTEC
jgi:hypothetical protein